MDIGKIEQVMQLMQAYGFNEIQLENGEEKLKLVQHSQHGVAPLNQAFPPHFAQVVKSPPTKPTKDTPPSDTTTHAKRQFKEIRSPFVGTFYSSQAPGEPAFVEVGSLIKKGDTLCIVEAMKLMNEIEAEFSGKIVEILVSNEEPIEYDQVLFHVE